MTPKQMSAKEIKELVALNEQLTGRVKELEATLEANQKAVASQTAATPAQPSKSRIQAEAALALLKAGPVSTEQLKQINPKYPSDPIYFVRSVLKLKVKTNRSKDGQTTYVLEDATAPTA